MARKSDLDIALAKRIRSLSTREEKIYADMKLSDKNISSDFATECMSVMSEISSDVMSASIEELEQKLLRISELKKYINQANIGKREKSALISNAEKISSAIKKDLSGKNNILKKASSALGGIAGRIDSETVMRSMFGDDEAGKLLSMAGRGVLSAGKFAAGKIKEGAAKRKENRAVLKRDALSIVDKAKKPTRALPLPQPLRSTGTDTDMDSSAPQLMTNSRGGGGSLELKTVESLLSVISNDVKHIIQILDVNQDKEDEDRLDAIEASLEEKKGTVVAGSGTPAPEAKKSLLSSLMDNAPWLLKVGGLAGIAALAFEGLDDEIKNQIKKAFDDAAGPIDTFARRAAKAILDAGKNAIGLPNLDITTLPPSGASARGSAAGKKYAEKFKKPTYKPTGNVLSKTSGLKPPEVKIPKAPGVASKAAFLGKEVAKDLGRAAFSPLKLVKGMPLISGGLSAAERYSEGQDVGQIALGVAAETAGGAAGAWGGAAAGAAAGMILGPVGSAIGGVIGGLIGGLGGSYLGGAAADTAYEKLAEESTEATENSTEASENLKTSQEKLQESVDKLNESMKVGPGYQPSPTPTEAPVLESNVTSNGNKGKLNDAAFQKTNEIAGRLGMKPEHLMSVMDFETGGTFDPAKKNPRSSATGLIQFMGSTAEGLGTSTSQLRLMSQEKQLDYVEKYLERFKGRLNTVEDAYMAVFHPAAVGKSNDYVLHRKGSKSYRDNRELDTKWGNNDGVITKEEASRPVASKLGKYSQPVPVERGAGAAMKENNVYVDQSKVVVVQAQQGPAPALTPTPTPAPDNIAAPNIAS